MIIDDSTAWGIAPEIRSMREQALPMSDDDAEPEHSQTNDFWKPSIRDLAERILSENADPKDFTKRDGTPDVRAWEKYVVRKIGHVKWTNRAACLAIIDRAYEEGASDAVFIVEHKLAGWTDQQIQTALEEGWNDAADGD